MCVCVCVRVCRFKRQVLLREDVKIYYLQCN